MSYMGDLMSLSQKTCQLLQTGTLHQMFLFCMYPQKKVYLNEVKKEKTGL